MTSSRSKDSEFLKSVRNGAVIGALVLVVAVPWIRSQKHAQPPVAPTAPHASVPAPAAPAPAARLLADFGDEQPSGDARHVANWAFFTGDNGGKAVVVLDKKAAKVYTFEPTGRLVAATPALFGSAIGDDSAPGIGDKPLAEIQPHERTTPAGRFVAQPGMNTNGEDIIWIDYDAAVSMHRVRPVLASERRFERLNSPTHEDNRISNGCVNLPVDFYERVLGPAVKKTGAIVYVLPETRPPEEVFGSFDVTDPQAVAAAGAKLMRVSTAAAPAQLDARRNRDQ